MTVPGIFRNKVRTGYEILIGNTLDISDYVDFEFYDYCWYWDSPMCFPHDNKHLGIRLGVAHRVGHVSSLDLSEYFVNKTKGILKNLDNTIKGGHW